MWPKARPPRRELEHVSYRAPAAWRPIGQLSYYHGPGAATSGLTVTMNTQQLKKTLKRLHAELESTGTADPELKNLLRDLDDDIQRLTEDDASPGERLEQAAVGFEAEHPRVAMLLRELQDTLAKLGL